MGEKEEASTSSEVCDGDITSKSSATTTRKAAMLSSAEICSKLKKDQKHNDPYWKVRFCEACMKKLRSARKTLTSEFERRDVEG